jgi:ABC-type branched-subunit amino acid transport system ATPase component
LVGDFVYSRYRLLMLAIATGAVAGLRRLLRRTAFDRLRGEVAMVIVEHNLDLVLAIADRAYVLERAIGS